MRSTALASLAFLTSACASAPDMSPVNKPWNPAAAVQPEDIGMEGDVIALAFSGGGARAAAFSYGVLLGLRDMKTPADDRLIDRVALVTAVSGGSITAAYFGQHGPDDLDGFRAAALDKDWAGTLHDSWISPGNWTRLLNGGLNGRDRLADWLDTEVFSGGEMGSLKARPRILINATELYTGAPFAFAAPWFDALCSDLSTVRIADAVAASMAVPLAFRPTVLASYPSVCSPAPWIAPTARNRSAPVTLRETARSFQSYRDPDRMKYLHLVDGGVVDNFGVATLVTLRHASGVPHGPLSARDAVRLRSLTFVVVNAEVTPAGDWPLVQEGPDGAEVVAAALEDSIKATKRNAFDAFAAQLSLWQGEIISWRCALGADEAARLGAEPGWTCSDLSFSTDMISFADLPEAQYKRLGALPTAVSLETDAIDDLIAGGREAAIGNDSFKSLAAIR